MIHYQPKGKHVLGVYVAGTMENPDLIIRQTLGLETQQVLTPYQMSNSDEVKRAYIMNATRKVVYSRSNFLGKEHTKDDAPKNDVHIYLEKSSQRILVRVRHNMGAGEDYAISREAIEHLVVTLSEKGFRPVESRIEDIPGACFV